MKALITLLFILILPYTLWATAQDGDRLIWNGDTLTLFANPLELRKDIQRLRPKLFGGREAGMNTGCWRGYIAEWIVLDRKIYLNNIYSCSYMEDGIKADLQALFGSEFKNGKVKADWLTDTLIAPKGRIVHYVHDGYQSFFEKELMLVFENGKLKSHQQFDNSGSHKAYFRDGKAVMEAIYRNIDWNKIPCVHKGYRVLIDIRSGRNPKPESVTILRSAEPAVNTEIIKAVKMLTDWNVYYRLGKVSIESFVLPLWIDERMRKAYANIPRQ